MNPEERDLVDREGDALLHRVYEAHGLGPDGKPRPSRNGEDDAATAITDGAPPMLTDLANARRLVLAHGADLRHAPQLGAWYEWDERRWAEDLTGEVFRRAKAVVDGLRPLVFSVRDATVQRKLLADWQRAQAAGRVDGMVRLAATEPGVPVLVEQLDADPWLLNCQNGTLDLRTGELHAHRHEDLLTKLVPVAYDVDAAAPRFEAFLEEVLPDAELRWFVWRALGAALTGDVSDQRLFMPYGAGANGKSTLFNLIRRLLADYAVQLAPDVLWARQHDQHPTGLTDLRGARLAVTIEVEQGRRLAEALTKMLTGGETIRARRMRCDFFEFPPTHKLWLAVNYLPIIRGTDTGIWRRIIVVPFTVTIPKEDQDPHLPERLWAERAGVLAWLVRGCLAWQRDGLNPPTAALAATERYRVEQDHLGAFLTAACDLDAHHTVNARALRDAYEQWCTQAGAEPVGKTLFGRLLADRGYPTSRDRRSRHGLRLANQTRCSTTDAQVVQVPPKHAHVRAHEELTGEPAQRAQDTEPDHGDHGDPASMSGDPAGARLDARVELSMLRDAVEREMAEREWAGPSDEETLG